MKLDEVNKDLLKLKTPRAGIYPIYTNEEGNTFVFLMIPSNPKFGGTQAQMGKGGIDEGETAEQAAIREGYEELGLVASNIDKITQLTTAIIRGKKDSYEFTVFVAEVKDPDDFDPYGWESGWAGWVELEEAIKTSRKNQQQFLKLVKNKYTNQPLEEAIDKKDEKIRAYEEYNDKLQEELDKVLKELASPAGVIPRDHRSQLHKQKHVLQAKIAHAKSQIDLILRLDVDPVPAAYGVDDARSHGFAPDSLGEWAKSIAPMIKRIKQECQPYLDATEHNIMEYRLYRGMRGADGPYATGRVRLDDRQPMATGAHVHEAVNNYFTEKFGEPFRNSLFTSANANFAADYGNLFLIFPSGQFTFVWSPLVDDLYNYEYVLDEALEEDDKEVHDWASGNFKAAMDHYEYQDSGFITALESRQEIMIRTPVYYGINLSNFWKRDDDDDDSIGKMDGVNQAMKIIQELLTDEI